MGEDRARVVEGGQHPTSAFRAETSSTGAVLHGEMGVPHGDAMDQVFAELRELPVPSLVVDLSAVTFCDSLGLRHLIGLQQARPGEIVLRGLSPSLQRLITLCGLDDFFQVERAG